MIRPTTWLLTMMAVLALLTFGPPASAQAVARSKCGEAATGTVVGDTKPLTLTTEQADRMYVDHDGFWRQCQPWIRNGDDPYTPEGAAVKAPPSDCKDTPAPIQWAVGNRQCTSFVGFGPLAHGQKIATLAEVGSTRGMAVMQCVDGKVSVYGATCDQAQRCELATTVFFGPGNSLSVVVDGANSPLNAGERRQDVPVVGAPGVVATVQCNGGSLAVVATKRKGYPFKRLATPTRPASAAGG